MAKTTTTTTTPSSEEPTGSDTTDTSPNTGTTSQSKSSSSTTSCFTDTEFQQWLLQSFQKDENHTDLYNNYKETFEAAALAITKWRIRYKDNPVLWKRIFDKERIRKELIEAVPIIDTVIRFVEADKHADEEHQFTVVDLASGKGYLSMLLSEMLPPTKVKQFVLMDKAWAAHNIGKPQSHHINWDHIYGGDYYKTWPIPLNTSKQDLKSGRQRKALETKFFQPQQSSASGEKQQPPPRIILLAVHLCGILSLKAVDFFNHNTTIELFCLKPCCLPGIIHAKRKEIFVFTTTKTRQQQQQQETTTSSTSTDAAAAVVDSDKKDENNNNNNDDNNNNPPICLPVSSSPSDASAHHHHSFEATKVCMPGKWNKNVWKGPNRNALRGYFDRWATNLFLGIGISENGNDDKDEDGRISDNNDDNRHQYERYQQGSMATKIQKTIRIQTEGGYQNEFLFAQRTPITSQVWDKLLLDTTSSSSS